MQTGRHCKENARARVHCCNIFKTNEEQFVFILRTHGVCVTSHRQLNFTTKNQKLVPHSWKFCRSNLSQIISERTVFGELYCVDVHNHTMCIKSALFKLLKVNLATTYCIYLTALNASN